MPLPKIPRSALDVRPIDWTGLPRRFLNPGELETLIALVRSVAPRSVLEIGVNVGRTAKAILDNVPGIETYQGVDVLPGYVPSKDVQKNERADDPGEFVKADARFELILRARGSLDLSVADLKSCDVAFIDGDHGRDGVTHDTALARQIVRPGGIIIWHDYHDLGTVDVREVLDEFGAAGEEIFHIDGTWIAYQYQPSSKKSEPAA
jgi:predicted O-methyltransferase YrrM